MGCFSLLPGADRALHVGATHMIYGLAGLCIGLPVGIVIGVALGFRLVGGVK